MPELKEKISVVVPLFNEAESLTELYNEINKALSPGFDYEVIFVDDGSTDTSWDVIERLSSENEHVLGIKFRRNYGKSSALNEGFKLATGDYVATMDADLQDDPNEVPEMVEMLRSGYDLVSGWKQNRQDPVSKTIPSLFFNFVTRLATGIKLNDFNCGLKVYRKEVVERMNIYGEMHRYIPVLAKWDGYAKIGEKKVKHHPRKYGTSKFGLSRFINGFLDLITLLFINIYLQKPMHFFGSIGTISLIAGSGITTYLVIMRLFFDQFLAGRPLLLFGILLILLGIQFITIGLFGEMMYRNRYDRKTINVHKVIK